MTETEIKARLFEIQGHVCNGRLTIHPDGHRDPDDHGCYGCAEYLRLSNELMAMMAAKAAGGVNDAQ